LCSTSLPPRKLSKRLVVVLLIRNHLRLVEFMITQQPKVNVSSRCYLLWSKHDAQITLIQLLRSSNRDEEYVSTTRIVLGLSIQEMLATVIVFGIKDKSRKTSTVAG